MKCYFEIINGKQMPVDDEWRHNLAEPIICLSLAEDIGEKDSTTRASEIESGVGQEKGSK